MSNTGKEMACICELYINGKQGIAVTPLELRQILLKAGYESQIREYHSVVDLSGMVITLLDSGLTEGDIRDFFEIYLKACSGKLVTVGLG